jgi:hypothetical protein
MESIYTLLAHPAKTKIIAQARLKNDKLDSNGACRSLKGKSRVRIVCARKERRGTETAACQDKGIKLVAQRTSFKNKIHAIFAIYTAVTAIAK